MCESKLKYSWCKSTDGGCFVPIKIVRNIIVGGDHNVTVSISKVVSISFVQMAGSSRITCAVIGVVSYIGWA